eukprot:1236000-Ditylum_brightwellii.AAC.1
MKKPRKPRKCLLDHNNDLKYEIVIDNPKDVTPDTMKEDCVDFARRGKSKMHLTQRMIIRIRGGHDQHREIDAR